MIGSIILPISLFIYAFTGGYAWVNFMGTRSFLFRVFLAVAVVLNWFCRTLRGRSDVWILLDLDLRRRKLVHRREFFFFFTSPPQVPY